MNVSIGHNNYINSRYIVAIVQTDSSPFKKLRCRADKERMLVNATGGRKSRSAIVMSSNHVILSALQADTLKERIKKEEYQYDHGNR
ncbi:conserved uncharacterized protein, DUF370 [Desulfosarcina variabilis str. Montpellier]|uniref:DUF370 domain-containing protein n=1 Tax=Desulfosarcina variabilis TaxID=2300 RepID=UPI003AFB6AF6